MVLDCLFFQCARLLSEKSHAETINNTLFMFENRRGDRNNAMKRLVTLALGRTPKKASTRDGWGHELPIHMGKILYQCVRRGEAPNIKVEAGGC